VKIGAFICKYNAGNYMKTRKRTAITGPTMTVDQAATRLNIGRNQAYEAARTGQIPVMRIGKRYLVLREPLERMLRGEGPAPEAKAGSAKAA